MTAARLHLIAQGGRFRVSPVLLSSASSVGGGRRGKVWAFSSASRKRLLDKLASVRVGERPLFLTLTYRYFYSPSLCRRHLTAFYKRLRRVFPRFSMLWRLEYQKRGAVHFHCFVYNVPFIPFAYVRRVWGEVTGEVDQLPQVRIEAIRSERGVMSYASKYLAKTSDLDENRVGFRYGTPFLDYSTYLAALRAWGIVKLAILQNLGLGRSVPTGRYWGVMGSCDFPLSDTVNVSVRYSHDIYVRAREFCKSIWKGAFDFAGDRLFGCTLYVSDAEKTLQAFMTTLSPS